MWAKLNRFVDAVVVDGKFKYYNEVRQNPNQNRNNFISIQNLDHFYKLGLWIRAENFRLSIDIDIFEE